MAFVGPVQQSWFQCVKRMSTRRQRRAGGASNSEAKMGAGEGTRWGGGGKRGQGGVNSEAVVGHTGAGGPSIPEGRGQGAAHRGQG